MVDFRVKNLSFAYPDGNDKALKSINLEINSGEFVVICGPSGCGKSTLLRMLKPELSPHGKIEGEICFFGKKKEDFSLRESAQSIGFLLQNPEYQAVTHSVRSELAFGLENLGFDSKTIRLRIAEISAYFSLEKIIDKKISELSGGQKQLVCLASILALHPKTVIFDEPTSQLDPAAAENLLTTARKLCRENGITVIISEHRLESVIPMADRLIIMDSGEIISDSPPEEVNPSLFNNNPFVNCSMPFPMRLFSALEYKKRLPLGIGEARKALSEILQFTQHLDTEVKKEPTKTRELALEAKHINFSYDRKNYVLNDFGIKIPQNSFYAILGANAAGKTTALSILSGLMPCKSGKIKIFGKNIKDYKKTELYNGTIAVLPQKCESLFGSNTLKEDLLSALDGFSLTKEEKEEKIISVSKTTEILSLLERHPYDISGGEMQRAALAIVLLKEPKILFMDEPTKGMDALFKKQYAKIIKNLCSSGTTVIAVSHDTEFCAKYADICAMVFEGKIILETDRRSFFASNFFYTTAANKIAREIFPFAVTEEEVLELCKKSLLS